MQLGRRKRTAAELEAAQVIGAALRAMRLRANLSYPAMVRAGIPRSTAYKLEHGLHTASFLLLARWCRACGCSTAVLEDELERYTRMRPMRHATCGVRG